MNAITTKILIPLMIIIASGCGHRNEPVTTSGAAPMEIENVTWTLVQVGGNAVAVASDSQPATLRLDSALGKASGYGGVNHFSATYKRDGTGLTFGPIIATRRAGAAGAMATEDSLFVAMKATTGVRIVDNRLQLLAGETIVAVFGSS